jgi:CubicO group peptidase (beta-lactamase class C family)
MFNSSFANPSSVGIDPDQYRRAVGLLRGEVESGTIPGAGLCVGRRGGVVEPEVLGTPPGSRFLVASLTKPVVAVAAMLLVERGSLGLDDRVVDFLPDFAGDQKDGVRVRHLLTHTSGLPDQLPENVALRASHAPLSAFIEGACRQPLLFPPGTKVRYQSMGFALLSAIIGRIAGRSLGDFLRTDLFEPLGMHDTALGVAPESLGEIATCRLPAEQEGTDWSWNSPYWLGLGAPWGGLVTSLGDYARLSRMMLDGGTLGKTRVLGPASVQAMTRNQLNGFPSLPEEERRCRPWGLGWRLQWPGSSANFGDLLGPNAYGHWGATGTVCWIDPDADAFFLLFTTLPGDDQGTHLARYSNMIAASLR